MLQRTPQIVTKEPSEWEKMFANISDTGLVSKMYIELLQLTKNTMQLKTGQRT